MALSGTGGAALKITEFAAINSGSFEDRFGSSPGWIEIFNDGDESVDLINWYLTDDSDQLTKWRFQGKSIPPQGYLVVAASGRDYFSIFQEEVHTSFSLTENDDYLALVEPDGTTVASAYVDFPESHLGTTYGLTEDGEEAYFGTPTPGEPNKNVVTGFVGDTKFSMDRGFYESAIEVAITCETEEARIIYTTDGREPSEGSIFTGPIGTVYDGPITIEQTTVVRAAAFKEGLVPSNIDTHTYLFVADVPSQPEMRSSITESAIYKPQMEASLKAVPTFSLVLEEQAELDNRNGPNDERLTSVEILFPDGSKSVQVNAGASRFGGYFTDFAKKNIRLNFRKRYGDAKLDYPIYRGFERGRAPAEEFDSINLRTGSHDMVARGAYMSNRFCDDTMLEMGSVAPHGRFVHVYQNGVYWGQYHLRERWGAAMFASYFGGDKSDYDSINANNVGSDFINPGEPYDGSVDYWASVNNAARTSDTPYAAVREDVDMNSYFDFMVVWTSGQSESEYRCSGSKSLGVPFQFFIKDADGYLRPPPSDRARHNGPGRLMVEMRTEGHEDFLMAIADRIHKHFFNGGAFTPERNIARLQDRVDEARLGFIAEAARWNYRTPSEWEQYQTDLIEDHFPELTDTMIERFKNAGYYPEGIQAPILSERSGYVDQGVKVTMMAGTLFHPEPGDFYYTIDGTDPRQPGGEVTPGALVYDRVGNRGVEIDGSMTLKARTLKDDRWSPLSEEMFYVGQRAEHGDLVISEIHYRPLPPSAEEVAEGYTARSDFEFLEIYNTTSESISLGGLKMASGIAFDFDSATINAIEPGGVVLLVRNTQAFETRYGEGLPIVGEFGNSKLSDSGESVRVSFGDGSVFLEFSYNDKLPWPEEPDGSGPSLTLVDPAQALDPGSADSWVASSVIGGTPGRIGDTPVLPTDADGDGLPAFAEEALGSSDSDPSDGPDRFRLAATSLEVDGVEGPYWVASTTLNPAAQATITLESSTDLKNWKTAEEFTLLDEDAGERRWRSVLKVGEEDVKNLYLRLSIRGE